MVSVQCHGSAARTLVYRELDSQVSQEIPFEGRSLRDLLIEAIRYGERPKVRSRSECAVGNWVDRSRLQELIQEKALAHDTTDASRVVRVREEMERPEARRLQLHSKEIAYWDHRAKELKLREQAGKPGARLNVEFLNGDRHRVHYIRRPFWREPDFGATSVHYDMKELLTRAEVPR